MAESQVVAEQALKKLKEQLTCAICLDTFKDPKLLQCFHVYCKDCLRRLVVQDDRGRISLRCPTCRQSTLLPSASTVSDLQPAFHIHNLFEIQKAVEKVKDPQKLQCDKCKTPRQATSYCRNCGEFICDICNTVHKDWDAFSKHEVVSLEQLESKIKQLDSLKKLTLYCSLHEGKALDLYCETCDELICLHCTIKKHKDHQYDLVGDMFKKHEAEITGALKRIQRQQKIVNSTLKQVNEQSQKLSDQRVAIKANMEQQTQKLYELLEVRKTELIGQLDEQMEVKMKHLASQKDQLEMTLAQLDSCLSFASESLRVGNKGEVIKMRSSIMKQVKELSSDLKLDASSPYEVANLKFIASPELTQACQEFGRLVQQKTSPEKCYAEGRGLVVAELGEKATAVLYIIGHDGMPYIEPVGEAVTCELVSDVSGEKIACSVKQQTVYGFDYEISYQPTSQGRYKLHVIVEGEHINESPFSVTVIRKLGTPIKIIDDLKRPWGVVIDQKGNAIVVENGKCCVSVISSTGENLLSFGNDFIGWDPIGVAVGDDGNILVSDASKRKIFIFTSNGKYKTSTVSVQFDRLYGLAIHPHTKEVCVANRYYHRVEILHPDMTFNHSFNCQSTDSGKFNFPWDVAFDSSGNMYVVDTWNRCIQVFSTTREFVRQFGQRELGFPSSISIDSGDNIVYVTDDHRHCVSIFTCEGEFLTSFGEYGKEPGQFSLPRGVAVDKNGVVYVSDHKNNRLQLF